MTIESLQPVERRFFRVLSPPVEAEAPPTSTVDALTRWARKWLGGSKGRTLESLQAAQGKLAAERAAHETALANHGDERRELLLANASDEAILQHGLKAERAKIALNVLTKWNASCVRRAR